MSLIDAALLPFQFAFMNKAFLIMAIIAVPTSLLSCYLVLKGWSLMGDAISHAVLPGIVLAYIAGIPLIDADRDLQRMFRQAGDLDPDGHRVFLSS